MIDFIHSSSANYGKVKIVLEKNKYFVDSPFPENVAGKVVVIARASSGIGEHLAYEYGSRGAYLVIGARRDEALRGVAETARWLGSPLVVPMRNDISKAEDCKRLIEQAIESFGQLDHLVIPAGISTPACMFEDTFDVTNFKPAMRRTDQDQEYTLAA